MMGHYVSKLLDCLDCYQSLIRQGCLGEEHKEHIEKLNNEIEALKQIAGSTAALREYDYKTLKKDGLLIIRGVDRLDCWDLKYLFKRGQGYLDQNPISKIDYEAVIDAGFKNVELVPLYTREYYKTKEDLYALLQKTPILDDFSEEVNQEYERKPIERDLFEQYVKENSTSKGIKLVRRYYGIIAKK